MLRLSYMQELQKLCWNQFKVQDCFCLPHPEMDGSKEKDGPGELGAHSLQHHLQVWRLSVREGHLHGRLLRTCIMDYSLNQHMHSKDRANNGGPTVGPHWDEQVGCTPITEEEAKGAKT